MGAVKAIKDILIASPLHLLLQLDLAPFGLGERIEQLLHHLLLLSCLGDGVLEREADGEERLQLRVGCWGEGYGLVGRSERETEDGLRKNWEAICRVCVEFINCLHGNKKLIKEFKLD